MTSRNVEHSKTWKQSGSTGLQDQNEKVAGRTERRGDSEGRGAGVLSTQWRLDSQSSMACQTCISEKRQPPFQLSVTPSQLPPATLKQATNPTSPYLNPNFLTTCTAFQIAQCTAQWVRMPSSLLFRHYPDLSSSCTSAW